MCLMLALPGAGLAQSWQYRVPLPGLTVTVGSQPAPSQPDEPLPEAPESPAPVGEELLPNVPDPISRVFSLSLTSAELPPATRGTAYEGFDFKNLVVMEGDELPAVSSLGWGYPAGLPAGMQLSTAGVLTGTPSTEGSLSFTVVASYEGTTGQQVYTLNINGVLIEAVQIATGQSHSCALLSNNSVKCWGYNNVGQLGDGTTTNRNTPVTVMGLPDSAIKSLALGYDTSCVVTATDEAWCWGKNDYGQLGRGTSLSAGREVPAKATHIGAAVLSMSMGDHHACAVTVENGLRCWGRGASYRLGNNATGTQLTAIAVPGMESGVLSVSSGDIHTCALKSGGSVWCWGAMVPGGLATERRRTFEPLFRCWRAPRRYRRDISTPVR